MGGSKSRLAGLEDGNETGGRDSDDIGGIAGVGGSVSEVGWWLTWKLRFLSEDKLVCVVKVF